MKQFNNRSFVNRLIGYSVIRFFLVLFTFYLLLFTFTNSVYALECNTWYGEETSGKCPDDCQIPNYIDGQKICSKNYGDYSINDIPTVSTGNNTSNGNGSIINPALENFVGRGEGNIIIATLLAAIIRLFFIAGSVAVLVFFLIGGLAWITSEGDKGKMELARNRLTYAGVGIVIIAATYAILQILGSFLGIKFFEQLIIDWPTLTGP